MVCISAMNMSNANLALSDLAAPKTPAYRVGISDVPENPYVQKLENKNIMEKKSVIKQSNKYDNGEIAYSDLDIKRLSNEVSYDLECEEQEMISDLSLLWQGAAMQSDTINFALYKLANPEADKPDKSTVKNMLKTVASMSTLVGAGISNPLLAGSSLIGANILSIMGQDTKALNYKYSKVTDADMIILIRKVEDLQQKTVDLYYDYINAKRQLDITTKLAQERKNRFELAQKNNVAREIIVITDSHFRTAVDRQKTARSEFLSKRAALEQFVGNEAFNQFEKELALRENSENGNNIEIKNNYEQTISNVENYTNNLENKTASLSGIGYTEEDANLSKLEQVESLNENKQKPEIQENEKIDSVDNENVVANKKSSSKTKNNKKKKIKSKKEKTEKAPKVKKDPYDTKGFIFLHDKQPDLKNYTDTEKSTDNLVKEEKTKKTNTKKDKKVKEVSQKLEQIDNKEIVAPQSTPKATNFHGVELLPLDEIKVPDLKPNGYSIFAR